MKHLFFLTILCAFTLTTFASEDSEDTDTAFGFAYSSIAGTASIGTGISAHIEKDSVQKIIFSDSSKAVALQLNPEEVRAIHQDTYSGEFKVSYFLSLEENKKELIKAAKRKLEEIQSFIQSIESPGEQLNEGKITKLNYNPDVIEEYREIEAQLQARLDNIKETPADKLKLEKRHWTFRASQLGLFDAKQFANRIIEERGGKVLVQKKIVNKADARYVQSLRGVTIGFGLIAGVTTVVTIKDIVDSPASHLFDGEEGKSASDDFKQNLDGSTDPTSLNEG